MKNNKIFSYAMALVFLLSGPLAWSNVDIEKVTWPIADYNASRARYIPVTIDPDKIDLHWSKKLSYKDDRPEFFKLFINDNKQLLVNFTYNANSYPHENYTDILNILDGSEVWNKKEITSNQSFIRAFVGNVIYSEIFPENNHQIEAFDISMNGKLFINSMYNNYGVYSNSLMFNNQLYIAETESLITSFDLFTGQRVKSFYTNRVTQMAANKNYLISASYEEIRIFDRMTGDLVGFITQPDTGDHDGSLEVYENLMIMNDDTALLTRAQKIGVIDLSSKTISWIKMDELIRTVVSDLQNIYVVTAQDLVCIDVNTKKELWRKSIPDNFEYYYSQMIVIDNLIFINLKEKVIAVSKATHEVVWSKAVKNGLLYLGAGHLFTLDDDANLSAYKLN